jgi:hypothetical protein
MTKKKRWRQWESADPIAKVSKLKMQKRLRDNPSTLTAELEGKQIPRADDLSRDDRGEIVCGVLTPIIDFHDFRRTRADDI